MGPVKPALEPVKPGVVWAAVFADQKSGEFRIGLRAQIDVTGWLREAKPVLQPEEIFGDIIVTRSRARTMWKASSRVVKTVGAQEIIQIGNCGVSVFSPESFLHQFQRPAKGAGDCAFDDEMPTVAFGAELFAFDIGDLVHHIGGGGRNRRALLSGCPARIAVYPGRITA